MKRPVTNLAADTVGEVELNPEIFGLEPRGDILARVVEWQLAKRRAGTRKTLTRAEIDRTTRKMYKQKGTGQARHGSQKVPQFRGGGRAMGPVVRSHAFDLPKQVRALGLKHALSAKAKADKLVILDQAAAPERKTKAMAAALAKLGLSSALIVDAGEAEANFALATRNIPGVQILPTAGLNVYDILRRDTLVLTKGALAAIEERLK